jgi:hypothetical protein
MALTTPSASGTKSNRVTAFNTPSSPVSVLLLKANLNRKGATFWNECTANLLLEFALNAAVATFTVKLTPGSYYEIPFDYTGPIAGIWDGEDKGTVLIREFI